jgi:hypothetical protein
MDDDDLQRKLACDGARFVQDLRVLAGSRVEARVWSLSRHAPIWTKAKLPDWMTPDQARAVAQSGRLIAQVRHRQWMLTLVGVARMTVQKGGVLHGLRYMLARY